MSKRIGIALGALLFVCVGLQEAQAQASIQLGPRIGYDINEIEEFFIGADVRIGLVGLPVEINPTFDYFFTDDGLTIWQLSGNVLLPFGIENQVFTPYAGAGLGITNTSIDSDEIDDGSSTDVGLNLIFGAKFLGLGSLQPFAQIHYTVIGDLNPGWIGGGLLFGL